MFYIPIHLLYKRQHFLPCVPLSVGLHSEDTQLFCVLLGTVEFETRNVILALTKQQVHYLGHYISTINIHILLFVSVEVRQICAYKLLKEQNDVFLPTIQTGGGQRYVYLKFSRSVHNFTRLNPFSQCSIHASKFLNNKAAVALSKCCLSVGWTVENPVSLSAYSFGRGTSLDAMFWSCDIILINCCFIDFSRAFSKNGDYIIET